MADPNDPPAKAPRRVSAWVPARPHKLVSAPTLLSDVLVGAQDYAIKRSGSAMGRSEWESIVGKRIAGRTRVGKIWKGVLQIKVASSAWSNELSFLKPDLVAKLQRAGHEITDLRFTVDKIADDAIAPKRRPGAPRLPEPPAETQLPADLMDRLKSVADPNLRAAIAEAARVSLRKK